MRRIIAISVFILFVCSIVSCSLLEPSEKKGSMLIELNIAMPEKSASRGDPNEEPYNEFENAIPYSAEVVITWDGGVTAGSGTVEKSAESNKSRGSVAVMNVPLDKTLSVSLKIKDSDGDVLYSASKALVLSVSLASFNMNLECTVDVNGKVVIQGEKSEFKIRTEYASQIDKDEFDLIPENEIKFTCFNADGSEVAGNVEFEWHLNGGMLEGHEKSISFDPYTQTLIDLDGKNCIECFLIYSSGAQVSVAKSFTFNFDPDNVKADQYFSPGSENRIAFFDRLTGSVTKLTEVDRILTSFEKTIAPDNSIFVAYSKLDENDSRVAFIEKWEYSDGKYKKAGQCNITESYPDLQIVKAIAYESGTSAGSSTAKGYVWVYGYNPDNSNVQLVRCNEAFGEYFPVSNADSVLPYSEIYYIAVAKNYLIVFKSDGHSEKKIFKYTVTTDTPASITVQTGPTEISLDLTENYSGYDVVDLYPVTKTSGVELYILLDKFTSGENISSGKYLTGGILTATVTDDAITSGSLYGGVEDIEDNVVYWNFPDGMHPVCSPYGSNMDSAFFYPTGFYAIKDDELYIFDIAVYQEEGSDYGCLKRKRRYMKFNLSSKVLSKAFEANSINESLPTSGFYNRSDIMWDD